MHYYDVTMSVIGYYFTGLFQVLLMDTSKLALLNLCEEIPLVTGEFHLTKASNVEILLTSALKNLTRW